MVANSQGLEDCTRCGLSTTRQRVVIGSGPLQSPLVIIGEAPGADEDASGAPFIGRSGRLLLALIGEELSLGRDDCFITNVVKCRPPGNRTPTRLELAACRPWLEGQLSSLRPSVVLCVGATAVRSVLGLTEPMRSVHGRVVDLGTSVGVATYHPAAALRGGPNVVRVMREDLAVVRAQLERP